MNSELTVYCKLNSDESSLRSHSLCTQNVLGYLLLRGGQVKFFSIDEAIRVLRKGKKDEQWFDAASFLIDRASPEVKLMMDVGRELEKKDHLDADKNKKHRPIKKWVFILLAVAALGSGAGFVGWFVLSSIGLHCSS